MTRLTHSRVDVAGIAFDPITQEELMRDIKKHIASSNRQSFCIAKPYVEFFTRAWTDTEIAAILAAMDRVVADGVAVQWAASYLAGKRGLGAWLRSLIIDIQNSRWREQIIPERGAGVDATQKLLRHAIKEGWSIGVVGGPKDVERTRRQLQILYPKLEIVGVWSGYYNLRDEPKLVSAISKKYPDILFVAQGFPKQEQFIDRNRSNRLARVLIGEGGTFDFDSMGGDLKRAPVWLRRLGLEWLWRLIIEPNRWRRQLALPKFIWGIYRKGQQN